MKKNAGYIKKEAAEILDLKPSQIQYYTDIGIIEPEISAPKGRGTRRIYSDKNLLEILIAKRLIENGVPTKVAEIVFRNMRGEDQGIERGLPHDMLKLRKMFWSISEWDFLHSVFITYESQKYGDHVQYAVGLEFFDKKKSQPLTLPISENTKSLMVINVTDLVESLAGKLYFFSH